MTDSQEQEKNKHFQKQLSQSDKFCNQSTIINKLQSELCNKYLEILSQSSNTPLQDDLQKQFDTGSFQRFGVTYNSHQNYVNLSLNLLEQSINSQVVILEAKWGKFKTIIHILNVEGPSPLHKSKSNIRGNYGQVFVGQFGGQLFALKCIELGCFKNKNMGKIMAVKEYFLLKIAAILRIGPMMKPWMGFDLIMSENEIQFAMEHCEFIQNFNENDKQHLIKKLREMHRFNIVHFDIKPENIMFSPTFKKAVFIDFGLSEIIKESFGHKSLFKFRGTLEYCSPQMLHAFQSGEQMFIDVYYNDAHCLDKIQRQKMKFTGKQLNQEKQYELGLENRPIQQKTICGQTIILFVLKFCIFKGKLKELKKTNVLSLSNLANKYLLQFFKFFYEVYPTQKIKQFYQFQIQSYLKEGIQFAKLNQILSSNISQFYVPLVNFQKKQLFRNYFNDLLNLNNLDEKQPFEKAAIIEYLTQTVVFTNKHIYFHFYLKYISFSNNIFSLSMKERVRVTKFLTQRFFNCQTEEKQMSDLTIIKKAIKNILESYLKVTIIDDQIKNNDLLLKKIRQNILQLIQHIFILQIDTSNKLIQWIEQLSNLPYFDLLGKLQILLKIKHSSIWYMYSLKHNKTNEGPLKIYKQVQQWYNQICKQIQNNYDGQFNWIVNIMSQQKIKDLCKLQTQFQELKLISPSFYLNLRIHAAYKTVQMQQQMDTIPIFLKQIYQLIPSPYKQKCFYFLFAFYRVYLYNYSDIQKCFQIMSLISKNLNCQQLMDNLIIKYIVPNLYYLYYHKMNIINIHKLKYFFVNIQFQALNYLSNVLSLNINNIVELGQQIKFHAQYFDEQIIQWINQAMQGIRQMIQTLQLTKLQFAFREGKDQSHICITYLSINFYIQFKQQMCTISGIQFHILKQLKFIQEIAVTKIKCKKCLQLLQIIIILNKLWFKTELINRSQIKDQQVIQHQIISMYEQFNRLISQSPYQQKKELIQESLLIMMEYSKLSRLNQDKYHGILNLYQHCRQYKNLQRYLKFNKYNSRLLNLTLEVVLRYLGLRQFTSFLIDIAHFITKHYSEMAFDVVKRSFQLFLVDFKHQINFIQLLQFIEEIQGSQLANLQHRVFVIYFIQIIFFVKEKILSRLILNIYNYFGMLSKNQRILCQISIYKVIFQNSKINKICSRKLQSMKKKAINLCILLDQRSKNCYNSKTNYPTPLKNIRRKIKQFDVETTYFPQKLSIKIKQYKKKRK